MKNIDKYIKLVAKLNRLTKENLIVWEKTDPPVALKVGVDDIWVDFYTTKYADTKIGVGEARYHAFAEDYEKFYWTNRIVWALLDNRRELEYEFPRTEGTGNLLESIRHTLADVDNKINMLISAPDVEDE